MAQVMDDAEMIAALFERVNGPPRHINLTPRTHWSTWPLVIAAVCIFAMQLARGFLAEVLS